MRARVAENLLWKLLKQTDADKYRLRSCNIAVVKRHISKDEVISLIENSSAREFLHNMENDQETVVFTGTDLDKNTLGFFAGLFASTEYRIRNYQPLAKKVSKDLFDGDFSIVIYDSQYAIAKDESHYRCKMSVISGDTISLNNDGFRKKCTDCFILRDEINCCKMTRKRMDSCLGPYYHEYGRFFYQHRYYHSEYSYDDLFSYKRESRIFIENEDDRKKKIREKKDELIHWINDDSLINFLAISNCGEILEYSNGVWGAVELIRYDF
jgi:hypothetical protein